MLFPDLRVLSLGLLRARVRTEGRWARATVFFKCGGKVRWWAWWREVMDSSWGTKIAVKLSRVYMGFDPMDDVLVRGEECR